MAHITRAGVRLAYADTGSGPPVVLIHGFPFSRRMWEPQTPLAGAGTSTTALSVLSRTTELTPFR